MFCMTHSRKCVCCIYAKLSKHTPVEPHGQDVSSLPYTHCSYADRLALRSRSQPLWRYTERPWPAPALCPGHLEYIRAGGILDPPAVAGWMGGPAKRSPFQQPSMIDRRPHSLTPAAVTTHCDQNTHATKSTSSKTMTRARQTVTR